MPQRISMSQWNSQIRQMQQRQRQAINNYNNTVRRVVNDYNNTVRRAVNDYNRDVRAHNSAVRANQQRLRNELARLNSRPVTHVRYVSYRASVRTLHQSFVRVETGAERQGWRASDEFLDLSERETANSVAVLNALSAPTGTKDDGDDGPLRQTALTNELSSIDPDLDARWSGALFALSPRNPDAARHFCTSSREILTRILESSAPDAEVLAANPASDTTPDGRVTRRARITYCLRRRDNDEAELVDFVEEDLDNVITLFADFNDATHGTAGRFSIPQLGALKVRVEHAIQFLHRIVA
jgi:hypothetical protein